MVKFLIELDKVKLKENLYLCTIFEIRVKHMGKRKVCILLNKVFAIALSLFLVIATGCNSNDPDDQTSSSSGSTSLSDTAKVYVVYADNAVSITTNDKAKDYIRYTQNGAHLTITQLSTADSTTSGEIYYYLSGSSNNGSLYLSGSYKATVQLNGLELTNPDSAAINIQNGKRVKMSIKNETVNTLADGSGGAWKGCLMCKGHMEIKGRGTLNVQGQTAHAIWTKEYLQIKNCTVNVTGAVKDAINCNQYFLMESGALSLSGYQGDGIQVSLKTDSNGIVETDAENTGNLTLDGGTVMINTTASSGKALKYEGTYSKTNCVLTIDGEVK